MRLKLKDYCILCLFAVVGGLAMWWYATAAIQTSTHEKALATSFWKILFITAVVAGFFAPLGRQPKQSHFVRRRRFLLMAFALFIPQPFIAAFIFPPDPLCGLADAIVGVICTFGSFLGMSLRVILDGLRDKFGTTRGVQPPPAGDAETSALEE